MIDHDFDCKDFPASLGSHVIEHLILHLGSRHVELLFDTSTSKLYNSSLGALNALTNECPYQPYYTMKNVGLQTFVRLPTPFYKEGATLIGFTR